MSEIRELRELHLDSIRIDPALQPRVTVDQGVVAEYADAMEAGDTFPAIVVFHDGSTFWLADGWHRVEAARSVRDKRALLAEVHEGTRRDALLHSLGANADHGLRRTNEDKRKAVERVLADPEWATWSDREIARVCRVSNHLVADVRKSVTGHSPSERTYTTKHGTVATMNTAPIAAAAEARAAESVRTEPEVALYMDLERAVFQYLGPHDGPDLNLPERLKKLDALIADEFGEAVDEFEPYIGKPYRKEDLQRCLKNTRHMLGAKLQTLQWMREREAERAVKPENPWAPDLKPVERVEPETPAEPDPDPEPARRREPSAWAPDLKPQAQAVEEPIPDDVELTVRISGARDPAKRQVSVNVKTFKHGRKMIDRYHGQPPVTLQDLYAAITHMLSIVIEPEVLALAERPPEPRGLPDPGSVEAVERSRQPRQQDPFPAGTPVEFSGKVGILVAWKAGGRTAEIEGEDGRRHSMPAFMVRPIPEPETA